MDRRQKLQEILESLVEGVNVYYQPPSSVLMTYPAIVYSRNNMETYHADNRVYNQTVGYTVTVIDRNPDSEIVKRVAELPLCTYDRHYVSDNLNHDVYTLFY